MKQQYQLITDRLKTLFSFLFLFSASHMSIMNILLLICNPVANCLKKDLIVPAVCVLVSVSEKNRENKKVNVEENCYNEQVMRTVSSSKDLPCLKLKFIHLIYFRKVFFCHHKWDSCRMRHRIEVSKQIRTANRRMKELEGVVYVLVMHAHT